MCLDEFGTDLVVFDCIWQLNQHPALLGHSFVNFGLYLNLDGSQDGDVSTLHADSTYHSSNSVLSSNLAKVTIQRRPVGPHTICRPISPLNTLYRWTPARSFPTPHLFSDNRLFLLLQHDLRPFNQHVVDQFRASLAEDWSDPSTQIPDLDQCLDARDAVAIRRVWKWKYGEAGVLRLNLEMMGIPHRTEQGGAIQLPIRPGSVHLIPKWQPPPKVPAHESALVVDVLKALQLFKLPIVRATCSCSEPFLISLEKQEQTIWMTVHSQLSGLQSELEREHVAGRTRWLPNARCCGATIRARRWAALRGQRLGDSPASLSQWEFQWIHLCEQVGHLLMIEYNSLQSQQGTLSVAPICLSSSKHAQMRTKLCQTHPN